MVPKSIMTLNWTWYPKSIKTINWTDVRKTLNWPGSVMTINWTGVHHDFKLNSTGADWCEPAWPCAAQTRSKPCVTAGILHGISTDARCCWDWNRGFVLRGSVKDSGFSSNPYSSHFLFCSIILLIFHSCMHLQSASVCCVCCDYCDCIVSQECDSVTWALFRDWDSLSVILSIISQSGQVHIFQHGFEKKTEQSLRLHKTWGLHWTPHAKTLTLNASTLSNPHSLTLFPDIWHPSGYGLEVPCGSGSSDSFIDSVFVQTQHLPAYGISTYQTLTHWWNLQFVISQALDLQICFPTGESQNLTFYVTLLDQSCTIVLGYHWLTHYNPLIDWVLGSIFFHTITAWIQELTSVETLLSLAPLLKLPDSVLDIPNPVCW